MRCIDGKLPLAYSLIIIIMASVFSFDVESQFDMQEMRNAVDQVNREISTRYDFKGIYVEVKLNEDDIVVTAPDTMKLKAIQDMLSQKMVNRSLSPKILDVQEHEPAANSALRQQFKLVKALNQDQCKVITKLIKDKLPKVKSSIQGATVRVSSKSKDDLQAVMALLKEDASVTAPLSFTNYR